MKWQWIGFVGLLIAVFALGVLCGQGLWPTHDPNDDPVFEGVSLHQMEAADAAHRRAHPEAYDPAFINRAAPLAYSTPPAKAPPVKPPAR